MRELQPGSEDKVAGREVTYVFWYRYRPVLGPPLHDDGLPVQSVAT